MADGRTVKVIIDVVAPNGAEKAKKPIRELEAEVKRSQKAIEAEHKRTEKAIEQSQKALTVVQTREARQRANAFLQSLKEQETANATATKNIGGAWAGAAGVAAVAVAGLTAALYKLVVPAVQAGAAFERTRNALTAIAGSANVARADLADLEALAKRLPGLGLETAEKGFQRLRSVGFEAKQAKQILEGLSKVKVLSGGTQEDLDAVIYNLVQIRSMGKLTGDELKETLNRLPAIAPAIEKAFGTLSTEKIAKMGLTSDQFFSMLITQLNKTTGVTGGTTDAWEKLQDQVTLAGRQFSQPLLEPLTRSLQLLTQSLGDNQSALVRWGNAFARTVEAANYVAESRFAAMAGYVWRFLNPIWELLRTLDDIVIKLSLIGGNPVGIVGGAVDRMAQYAAGLNPTPSTSKLVTPNASIMGAVFGGGLGATTPFLGGGTKAPTSGGGGGRISSATKQPFKLSAEAQALVEAAERLGVSPLDLATIISYESAGTFSTKIKGGKGGNYQGLIQFGPPERRQYGVSGNQSFRDQLLNSVVPYFQDRTARFGGTQGMDILGLYKTVNGGNPSVSANASDGGGTIAQHVARMIATHRQKVLARFFGGSTANIPETNNVQQWQKTFTEMALQRQMDRMANREPSLVTPSDSMPISESFTQRLTLDEQHIANLRESLGLTDQTNQLLRQRNADAEATVQVELEQFQQREALLDVERAISVLRQQNENAGFAGSRLDLAAKLEELQLSREGISVSDQISNFGVNSNQRIANAAQRDRLELLLREEQAVIDVNRAYLELSQKGLFSANQSQRDVLEYLNEQIPSATDAVTNFKLTIADGVFQQIDQPFEKLKSKLEKLPPILRSITSAFLDLGSSILKMLSQGFLMRLLGVGGGASGGGGGLGSLFGGLLSGGAGGGGGLMTSVAGGGGAGGGLLGNLLGGGGLLGGLFGLGGASSAAAMSAAAAPGMVAPVGVAGAGAGGGTMASLGAFFTNPWTIGIGAGIAGGLLLWKFLGSSPEKKLRKAAKAAFGVDIKDKSVLKQLKIIGEAAFGKGQAGKRADEVVQLPNARDLIEGYAESTGQSTDKLAEKDYGSESFSGNQFGLNFSSGFDAASSGSRMTTPPTSVNPAGTGAATIAALAVVADAINAFTEKFGTANPADIIVANSGAVGEAIGRESQKPAFNEGFQRLTGQGVFI